MTCSMQLMSRSLKRTVSDLCGADRAGRRCGTEKYSDNARNVDTRENAGLCFLLLRMTAELPVLFNVVRFNLFMRIRLAGSSIIQKKILKFTFVLS